MDKEKIKEIRKLIDEYVDSYRKYSESVNKADPLSTAIPKFENALKTRNEIISILKKTELDTAENTEDLTMTILGSKEGPNLDIMNNIIDVMQSEDKITDYMENKSGDLKILEKYSTNIDAFLALQRMDLEQANAENGVQVSNDPLLKQRVEKAKIILKKYPPGYEIILLEQQERLKSMAMSVKLFKQKGKEVSTELIAESALRCPQNGSLIVAEDDMRKVYERLLKNIYQNS
jgi:hypothetical protein